MKHKTIAEKKGAVLKCEISHGISENQALANLTMSPVMNAGMAIDAFSKNLLSEQKVDISEVVKDLEEKTVQVHKGDLAILEEMLLSQASTLQTIFTSYLRRAQAQTYQRNLEAFMNLALKAQNQSRTTIQALAELKRPKQATYVNQANISNGPQQVNNLEQGHANVIASEIQNKLLEETVHERKNLVRIREREASPSDSEMETLDTFNRPPNNRRQKNRV